MLGLALICHGQNIMGENFVLGKDETIASEFTLHHDVLQRLGGIESLKGCPKIVMIDACRNDPTNWDKWDSKDVGNLLKKQLSRNQVDTVIIRM